MIGLRSVSAKLLLAITVAVLLPFLGFSVFVSSEMGSRLSRDVVRYFLKSKASDLADKINLFLAERDRDLRIWVQDPLAIEALQAKENENAKRQSLVTRLDQYCREKQVYDRIAVIDRQGRVMASNSLDRAGVYLAISSQELLGKNLEQEPWFRAALAGEFVKRDWHRSSPESQDGVPSQNPEDYGIAFAGQIRAESGEPLGVWYNQVNWSFVQVDILDRARSYFSELQSPESYQSGYAWLWKSDADHIIGHKSRALYGRKISEPPVALPLLREAALGGRLGIFPEYEWPPGTPKNAAYCWTRTVEEGGLGWIVGIGIDNEDILASVGELRQVLGIATALILGGIALWIGLIAATITRPVKNLIRETEEIARGNLEARVRVETKDEIGALANAFNRMAEDLAASRERVIRAEKEAAWREMARQVAHEIKNPLTPMRLSTNLLQKAWADGSAEFPKILEQTTQTLLRQIEGLRHIAADFSAFAGPPSRRIESVSLREVLDECAALYRGWSQEKRIAIEVCGTDATVRADPTEWRRLCINLLDNAMEAVGADGVVRVTIRQEKESVLLEFADTGPGISPEIEAKLFEPYFSTKTGGTGLGLAICRRIVHDLGGEIRFRNAENRGSIFTVQVPRSLER